MRLKQTIIAIAFFISACLSVNAQDIALCFTAMPGNLMPLLEVNRRKDLIDLYNDKKDAKVQNTLKGETVLAKMTETYLLLQTGKSGTEMMILTMSNHSEVICLIQNTCAPVCDSRIQFYTIDWQELPAEDFFTPANINYFYKEGTNFNEENLIQSAKSDIHLMQYQLDPDQLTLTQTYNTPQFWSKDFLQQVKPFLKEESKIFTWKKNRFQ